jgi:hypothetical protein
MNTTKCVKCGHESEKNRERFGLVLCSVCYTFSPNTPEELDSYVEEKIQGNILDSYRKYSSYRGDSQKKGMMKKSSIGLHMSRVPYGYKRNEEGILIPAQNSREIEEIYEEFLLPEMNLNKLAAKHNLSVNGLKKILKNFAYIGKIKFDGQIHSGNHQGIVSSILFNKVQDKLDSIERKKK